MGRLAQISGGRLAHLPPLVLSKPASTSHHPNAFAENQEKQSPAWSCGNEDDNDDALRTPHESPHNPEPHLRSSRRCHWQTVAMIGADLAHAVIATMLLIIFTQCLITSTMSSTTTLLATAAGFLALDLALDIAAPLIGFPPWILASRWLCGLLYLIVLVVAASAGSILPPAGHIWGLNAHNGEILAVVLLSLLACLTLGCTFVRFRQHQLLTHPISEPDLDELYCRKHLADLEAGFVRSSIIADWKGAGSLTAAPTPTPTPTYLENRRDTLPGHRKSIGTIALRSKA